MNEQVKNPKKRQEEIHKQISAKGIERKSQQDLNLQYEQCKSNVKLRTEKKN